eukprot:gene26446-47768_t
MGPARPSCHSPRVAIPGALAWSAAPPPEIPQAPSGTRHAPPRTGLCSPLPFFLPLSATMARIVFDLPPHFGFATELQIYISHVNQGGHLDNAQLLTLVSEARVRFFQSLGYPEADVGGLSIVVGDIVA